MPPVFVVRSRDPETSSAPIARHFGCWLGGVNTYFAEFGTAYRHASRRANLTLSGELQSHLYYNTSIILVYIVQSSTSIPRGTVLVTCHRYQGRDVPLSVCLQQTPKDKLRWWDHKQRILENWLDTSGDEITVEGASALIRGQLQRGEKHEHLRIKCWKHIVIELSALVEDDAAPSNGASAVMTARYTFLVRSRVPLLLRCCTFVFPVL